MTDRLPGSSAWADDPALIGGPSVLEAMWRRRVLLITAALIGFAIAYLLSSAQPPVYTATATVFLTDPSEAVLFGPSRVDPERHVQQQAARMGARAVFTRASEVLGVEDVGPDRIQASVAVTSNIAVGTIGVTATAGSPRLAAGMANAVVTAYEQLSGEAGREALDSASVILNDQTRELQQQADRLQARLEDNPDDAVASSTLQAVQAELTALRTRLTEVATEIAIYGAGVNSIERAEPPSQPSSPKPTRDGVVGAALGVALAAAYAYWRAGAKQTAQGDLSKLLDAPLLAEIPKFRATDPTELLFDTKATEAYQFIVPSLDFALARADGRSVLVTSATPREGKSLTALHLAHALATQGRRVVLVDSSLHTKGLSALLQAQDHPGLAELARGSALDDVIRSYRISPDAQLSFAPTGSPPNTPTGLLSTSSWRDAMTRIIDAYEMTVIDSEPLLAVADVSALAQQVAGIVLVVDAQTSHDALVHVKERMRLIETPLLGFVINRVPASRGPKLLERMLHNQDKGRNGHGVHTSTHDASMQS